jgi:hypothetical protein
MSCMRSQGVFTRNDFRVVSNLVSRILQLARTEQWLETNQCYVGTVYHTGSAAPQHKKRLEKLCSNKKPQWLLLPTHVKEHFILIVINTATRRLLVFDSIRNPISNYSTEIADAIKFACGPCFTNDPSFDASSNAHVATDTPLQSNAWDCGPCVIYFAFRILKNWQGFRKCFHSNNFSEFWGSQHVSGEWRRELLRVVAQYIRKRKYGAFSFDLE